MNHSARRVNALGKNLGARRYLEIGVSHGETFRDVEILEKTGVDPHFAFNTEELASDLNRFVTSTSDKFFELEPLLPAYDIVFIDGLHSFEQVVRDLSNSLIRTHAKSVLILDDTFPNDVYSALPDHAASIHFRKAAGSDCDSWHGDVFKTVFYIHDFWPSLNYRTISESGNPQTLVWRSNRGARQPVLNSFEKISRLSYFDLQNFYEILQMVSEETAISLCTAEIVG